MMIRFGKQISKSVIVWTLIIIVYMYSFLLYNKYFIDLLAFSSQLFWIFSIAFPNSIIFATAFIYRGRMSGLTEIVMYFRQNVFVFLLLSILLLLFNGFIVPHFNHIIAERQAIANGSSNPNNYKSDREKNISELYAAQTNMVINPKIKRQYLYEIYKKITIAFSIFANAFLGLSLAVIFKKRSVVSSILLFVSCFILYQLYVFLYIGLEDMEFFNPFIIMMVPLIVNIIIGSSLIAIAAIVKKIALRLNKNT